jgi:alpha-N-arabinofuranosidase
MKNHNSFKSGIKSMFALALFIVILTTNSCQQPPKVDETINVDIAATSEPINPFIYGQFIEHLGKCIYGGIWAEMLEDRKFYYPVTFEFNPWGTATDPQWNTGEYQFLNASPWQVIGDEKTVSMDKKSPFTGEHSPKIKLKGDGTAAGIKQAGIEFIAGKEYTGRIVLSGDANAIPVTVQITSENNETVKVEITEIGNEFKTYPLNFTVPFAGKNCTLEIFSTGKGSIKIGTISLMPADNIKGWRPDVVALLKELNSPIYRWPGGNFVSGYNWRDGIGEMDKRPPRKNPAWKGVEHNDVGLHEYMQLMEIIDSEAFVAVNTGLGTVQEVAEQIAYCRSGQDSPLGKLRAENGSPEAFNIKWWAVGNEMYGNWQLGHMPLSDYVKKHNDMAKAIWAVDPDAKLIGVGAVGEWSETMLTESADYMDLISEHIYDKELDNLQNHILQIKNSIKRVADAHRGYLEKIEGLKEKDIRIAMDEWNYWYGDYIYGELGVRYHQKDGLGIAMGLHEFFRNSDLYYMANNAQTVNVIGAIKTTQTASAFETTGLVLKLYRNQFGTIPVKIESTNPNLDISAALTEDQSALTIAVVNMDSIPQSLQLEFGDIIPSKQGQQWVIQNSNPEAYNTPGEEQQIVIEEQSLDFSKKVIEVPGYSVKMIKVGLAK